MYTMPSWLKVEIYKTNLCEYDRRWYNISNETNVNTREHFKLSILVNILKFTINWQKKKKKWRDENIKTNIIVKSIE